MSYVTKIDVVTRQNFNIKKRIMRNRFDKKMAGDRDGICPMAGNFKLHEKRCMCCERMVDGKTELLSRKKKSKNSKGIILVSQCGVSMF